MLRESTGAIRARIILLTVVTYEPKFRKTKGGKQAGGRQGAKRELVYYSWQEVMRTSYFQPPHISSFPLFLRIAISTPNSYLARYTYRVFIPTLLHFEPLEYCYYVKIKNCEFRVKWFSCYNLAGEWQRQDPNPDSSTLSYEGVGDTAWKVTPRIICTAISKCGNKCVAAKDDGFQVRWTRVYTLPLSLWPWENHLPLGILVSLREGKFLFLALYLYKKEYPVK